MWSVLDHLGLVYELAMRETGGKLNLIDQIGLLLHDASETYVVDMPRPIKHSPVGEQFQLLEKGVLRILFARFGIAWEMLDWKTIKRYDDQALWLEWVKFFPHHDKTYPWHAPKQVYAMDHTKFVLKRAKPLDYVTHLRHLTLTLRETVQIDDINGLFEMPEWLAPYVKPEATLDPVGSEVPDASYRNITILNKGIE
jgi:hypothetical protein